MICCSVLQCVAVGAVELVCMLCCSVLPWGQSNLCLYLNLYVCRHTTCIPHTTERALLMILLRCRPALSCTESARHLSCCQLQIHIYIYEYTYRVTYTVPVNPLSVFSQFWRKRAEKETEKKERKKERELYM